MVRDVEESGEDAGGRTMTQDDNPICCSRCCENIKKDLKNMVIQ